jgi:hypothetical protein
MRQDIVIKCVHERVGFDRCPSVFNTDDVPATFLQSTNPRSSKITSMVCSPSRQNSHGMTILIN